MTQESTEGLIPEPEETENETSEGSQEETESSSQAN